MARAIYTGQSAFAPVMVKPDTDYDSFGRRMKRVGTGLALGRAGVQLADEIDTSTAVAGLTGLFSGEDQRGAAVEALMARGRAATPVAAKEMPMAGDGPSVDIMTPSGAFPGDVGRSTTALREDLEDARARERFEAARASRDAAPPLSPREEAIKALTPAPTPGVRDPWARTGTPAVSPRDTAPTTAPATPATPAAAPASAPVADEFAALGAASPRARRDSLRYKDYSDRDLGDQIIEMAATAARGRFDVRKAEKLREEIARRPNRELIEQYIEAAPTAAPTGSSSTASPGTVREATGPTAPGAGDTATGERARDITRNGMTVPQYGRLGQEPLTPGAQESEEALRAAVPAASDSRTKALEADLSDTGVIGGMLKAAQQSLAGNNSFDTALDNLAKSGRAPTPAEVVALSRQAYTPEDQAYVVQLALESGLVKGRTLAEQRDPAGMYARVLPLLKFPDKVKKSSLEVYGDVLKDAGSYIRSRYGNDPEMFRALAQGMYNAGLIDIKQAREATMEQRYANLNQADLLRALKPPTNIQIGSTTITKEEGTKLPVPRTPGEEADNLGRRASAEEEVVRKSAAEANAKDAEYRQATTKFGPSSTVAQRLLQERDALRKSAQAAAASAAQLRRDEAAKRAEQLEFEKRGEATRRDTRTEKK